MAAQANKFLHGSTGTLTLLTTLNLLNYLDRYLLAGIVAPLQQSLGATQTEIGLLTSAFLIVYMIAAPLFGLAARRASRPHLLAAGIFIWSAATLASGFVHTLLQLLLLRALVGIGEAAYSTLGPALLAAHFKPERRASALSIFCAAIPIGTALSYIASGMLSQHWGWRSVFIAGGVPGLLLAFLCLRLREPLPNADEQASTDHVPIGQRAVALRTVFGSADFRSATIGLTAFTFAFGALAVWMPHYLTTVRGWSAVDASASFGIIIVAAGLLGTLGGGVAARALGGGSRACLLLCSLCMLAATPLTAAALYCTDTVLVLTVLFLAATFAFATQGPVNALVVNAVPADLRAFAVGANVLAIHALGDVPSPVIVGRLADSSWGWEWAMALIPAAMLLSAIAWLPIWRRP
ncbi:MAG: MFS transporter [Planctomycetes bacterium]|nr:MFS transporter [Planctomycetota bacterium]